MFIFGARNVHSKGIVYGTKNRRRKPALENGVDLWRRFLERLPWLLQTYNHAQICQRIGFIERARSLARHATIIQFAKSERIVETRSRHYYATYAAGRREHIHNGQFVMYLGCNSKALVKGQNPLLLFHRDFPVDGELANLLRGNWCRL